jgi:hypothetical protein
MYLVYFDTDQIKKYILGAPRLKEIRGASALLDDLNRRQTGQIVKQVAGNAGELVYAGGGSALAMVETDPQAKELIKEVEKLYLEATDSASITADYIELPEKQEAESFKKSIQQLIRKVRARKDAKQFYNPGIPHGLVQFCHSCASFPAEYVEFTVEGSNYEKEEKLCRSCRIKRDYSFRMRREQSLSSFMAEFAQQKGLPPEWDRAFITRCQPEDLDEIGKVSRGSNQIAMIYCDGNRMGLKIREIAGIEEYRRFAREVDSAIRLAAYHTMAEELLPRRLPDSNREIFPFEVIFIGGDDLVVVTAADKALEVAQKVSARFSEYTARNYGQRLTLSAGIVWAQYHYPIYLMLESAEALLKSAKKVVLRDSSEEQAGIDFMELTGNSGTDIESDRAVNLNYSALEEKFILTERPYTFTELESLISHIKNLKANRFPKNKLETLYRSVYAGKNQARYTATMVLSRTSEKAHDALDRFFRETGAAVPPPWRSPKDSKNTYISTIPDLIELYPYVVSEAGGDHHDG